VLRQTAGMRALPALVTAALCACSSGRAVRPRSRPCDALPLLGRALPVALAADAWGGVALAGELASAPLHAGNAGLDLPGGFVLRTDPDGGPAWIHGLGAARPLAVAIAPDGAVIVVGAAGKRCFAARLDAQGREIWSSQLSGEGESSCRAVALDERTGDIWAAGEFSGGVGRVPAAGMTDVLVLKIAGGTGEMRLARAIGGKGADTAGAIAVTGSGVVVVAGSFGDGVDASVSGVDFGRGVIRAEGGADGFLLALDPGGFGTRWVSVFGEDGAEEMAAVAVREGRIYAAANVRRGARCGGEVVILRNGEWARVAEEECLAVRGLAFDDVGRLWALEDAGRKLRARAFSARDGEALGIRTWAAERARVRGVGLASVPGGLGIAAVTDGESTVCGRPIGTAGEHTAFLVWVRDLG
jgi:hypothetical protein